MSASLIAEFATQFQATSAADKLFSLGLPRDSLLVHIDERGMQPPSSSNAPTTVVRESQDSEPDASDQPQQPHETRSSRASAEALRAPMSMGHARITIRLPAPLSEEQLTSTLAASGATGVVRSDHQGDKPNPAMWPQVDVAGTTDVERAIEASKGGAALDRLHPDRNRKDG